MTPSDGGDSVYAGLGSSLLRRIADVGGFPMSPEGHCGEVGLLDCTGGS